MSRRQNASSSSTDSNRQPIRNRSLLEQLSSESPSYSGPITSYKIPLSVLLDLLPLAFVRFLSVVVRIRKVERQLIVLSDYVWKFDHDKVRLSDADATGRGGEEEEEEEEEEEKWREEERWRGLRRQAKRASEERSDELNELMFLIYLNLSSLSSRLLLVVVVRCERKKKRGGEKKIETVIALHNISFC